MWQTFDRVHVLLVGQLIVGVALAVLGTLSLFTAIMLNALQGIRGMVREAIADIRRHSD